MNVPRIIHELQKVTGFNQSKLADELGVTQPTVSRWTEGAEPKSKHKDLIEKYARRKGVLKSVAGLNEDTVPVVGHVGAGGEILYEEGQGPFGEALMPPGGAKPETVAVIVRGDSMAGQVEDGWIVYYEELRDPPSDDLLGKLCVVGLRDGRVLIKKLVRAREPGHYDLYSAGGAVLLDQPVKWAARVTWIQLP